MCRQDTQALPPGTLPQIFRLFENPKKTLLKSSHTKLYLKNVSSQKLPRIENFRPKKSFNLPCHLKSGLAPSPHAVNQDFTICIDSLKLLQIHGWLDQQNLLQMIVSESSGHAFKLPLGGATRRPIIHVRHNADGWLLIVETRSVTTDFSLSYRVTFIPITYKQSARERREGRFTYMNDVFVIEIAVKAGEKGELYETGKHEVTPGITAY